MEAITSDGMFCGLNISLASGYLRSRLSDDEPKGLMGKSRENLVSCHLRAILTSLHGFPDLIPESITL